ncbi:2-polyprenyl-6-methoxyphenol hydroxylase-like FAD-dependent oxidoreductase [Nocardia kruczakiae]|uniref:2-polyprenyl-6-methoxyphenol hydroxylase-like FAD-dependent oxidoreductase n=1 Tax=Nocardia kruczakiae TaxID=261477 RepID=A0ABU1XRA1_9NOCA|nr:FAD-dependent oxidoreductase [Nocardia kruczakiae]MDR7173056.1 2-polyprenyl-6-methoxyphenol hydroxylase-like FAD-dependent oxidoreductase [Nocardia kruczakiae]
MTVEKQTTAHGDVLIIGAGPVGMTLALDLARRGVDVIIVEKQSADAAPRTRCSHISARSLELYRSLGIAAELRNAGLPRSHPQDVAYVTSLTGHELTRIPIPASENAYDSSGYAHSGWPTPEPPHRCNQLYWEPILREHLHNTPNIRTFYSTEITEIEQDPAQVTARGVTSTGEPVRFDATYLVGCDGGGSRVRKSIGARFEGDEVISGTRSVYIRSRDLAAKRRVDPAWMTWFLNEYSYGCVMALDGTELWSVHFYLPAGRTDFDSIDPHEGIKAAVGTEIDYDIVSVDDWYGRRLVADRFRDRRIFICGDAGHLWIPMAGYGMNAGIADAMTLAWQLAGVVEGWAEPGLLDAYEAERKPVTDQVSEQAMALGLANLDTELVRNVPPILLAEGPEAEAFRAEVGRELYEVNFGQFACAGLNFGTYYDASPVISYDTERAPAYDLATYTPSTVPGCRTPHIWLNDGRSLYDAMGTGFTLLRLDPAIDVSELCRAARKHDVPLKVIDLSPAEAGDVYRCKLVLSRPDQHVAWRGNTLPDDASALVDLVRGAANVS